ncbi:MAG: substrate-binding domain-containing protein [Solirubrobacteraceae bacterium]
MSSSTPAWSRIRRAAVLAVMAAVLAAAVAACGSTSSSSSKTASTAAATSSASSAGVTQAAQIVAQASQRPTAITVTTPVGKAIPSGKKIVFISCGAAECELQGNIIAQGAAKLGWTSSTIATDGSPAQIQNAFNTALRNGANAVILNATLRAEIGPELAAAQSKGVPMAECCATDPLAPPVIYNTSTAAQSATIGKYLAAEVVADSKGKANTLYVNIPAYTILATLGTQFQTSYKQLCPSCTYASIGVPLTGLATATTTIVSYVRSHPGVNYVALSVADALDPGLPAALSAAGLSHVKVVGQGGGPTSFQYMTQGQELALVPFDYYDVDYMMLDSLARHWAGVPVQLTPPPLWLITKANLPADHTQLFPNVVTYESQFLKLWGKS